MSFRKYDVNFLLLERNVITFITSTVIRNKCSRTLFFQKAYIEIHIDFREALMADISGSRDFVGLTELDALHYVFLQKRHCDAANRTQGSSFRQERSHHNAKNGTLSLD